MLQSTSRAALLFIALTLSACGYTQIRHSHDYESILKKDPSLLALTPDVTVTEQGLGSNKRMHDYEYRIQELLADSLRTALQNKGYRLTKLDPKDRKEKHIYRDEERLSERYKEVIKDLYKNRMKEEEAFAIEASVGKLGGPIAEKTGHNLLLLSTYTEIVQTNGSRVVMFLFMPPENQIAEHESLQLSIIDTSTGRVLWSAPSLDVHGILGSALTNAANTVDDVAKKKVDTLVAAALTSLPDAAALLQPKDKKGENKILAPKTSEPSTKAKEKENTEDKPLSDKEGAAVSKISNAPASQKTKE